MIKFLPLFLVNGVLRNKKDEAAAASDDNVDGKM